MSILDRLENLKKSGKLICNICNKKIIGTPWTNGEKGSRWMCTKCKNTKFKKFREVMKNNR